MSELRKALVGRISRYLLRLADRVLPEELRRPPRRGAPTGPQRGEARKKAPEHADERTMRRIAEAEHGGISSQESAERYARGENPGGTHHKAVHHDGPAHQRPEYEEPQERKETVPGHEKHIAVHRRGA